MSNKKKIKQLNEKVDELIKQLGKFTMTIRGSDIKLTPNRTREQRGN